MAVFRTVQGNTGSWLLDADRTTRVTFEPGLDRGPALVAGVASDSSRPIRVEDEARSAGYNPAAANGACPAAERHRAARGGPRVIRTVSSRMFASALQYNSSTRGVSANARLRWESQPGSERFVVYDDERDSGVRGCSELLTRSFVVNVDRRFRLRAAASVVGLSRRST